MAAKKTENLYEKRYSGRAMDEIRPITAKVGIVPSADGSAIFETGKTKAIAVVAMNTFEESFKLLQEFE